MHDLRIRFGFILALALLPLLVFAMIQSYFDFTTDARSKETMLRSTATQTAFDVVDTLDSAREILRITGNIVEVGEGCDAQLTNIISAVPSLDYLGITDPSGKYLCRANNTGNGANTYEFETLPKREQPFYTETRTVLGDSERYETSVIVSYGIFNSDGLERVVLAGFKLRLLQAMMDKSYLSEDMNIALINRKGEPLTGGKNQTPKTRLKWISEIKRTGKYEGTIIGPKNEERDIFVIESGAEGIYAAISSPKSSIWSWSILNPFSSLFVPLLAWLFGFGAIWVSTEKLILTHLRKMRRATIDFADGNTDRRIGELNNPPQSIHDLRTTFDLMADKITDREMAIIDSLDEKETLLREIHHRVKNNLQIIISLLNMQERKLLDPSAKAAVTETRSRINAISLVHRGLYESRDLRYVNMQTFLDRLIRELSVALGTKQQNVKIATLASCKPMDADTATTIALFTVEALTNAVKHGVSDGGAIKVEVTQDKQVITATVSDNGKGFIENKKSSAGTGMKLFKGFARQVNGALAFTHDVKGYSVSLTFSLRVEN